MPLITTRIPRRSQPQGAATVDFGRPLARDLYAVSFGARLSRRDQRSHVLDLPSGVTRVIAPAGEAISGYVNSGVQGVFPTQGDPPIQVSALTIFFEIQVNGSFAGNNRPIIEGSYSPIVATTDWTASSIVLGLGGDTDWTLPTELAKTSGVSYDNARVRLVASWDTTVGVMTAWERINDTLVRRHTGSTSKTSTVLMGGGANQRIGLLSTGCQDRVSVVCAGFFMRRLEEPEALSLLGNPWQLFAPIERRIWVPTSAGGGNVYNEAITESLSSSDAIACAAAFARAASEAALATDSQSATGTLAAAASESASATDAPVSVLVASAAVSESGSAADAVSAGAASYDVTVTEAASAADAVSVIATRVAAVSEALSAADAYTVTATMGAAVSENGSAADAVNWGGASYSVDIAETGTLADAVSAALQALAAISEVAGATDTPVAIISAGAAVLESAAAADLLAAARQITALLSEPATATDAVTFDADNVINAGIEESANATDGYVAVLIDGFLVLTASPRRVLTAGASRPANLSGRGR